MSRKSQTVIPGQNTSYLTARPDGRVLYSTDESADGRIAAWSVRPDGLVALGEVRSSEGGSPCHLAVHPSGRFVLVANYAGGSVAVLPASPDGAIGDALDVVNFAGGGDNSGRQSRPHAHMVVVDYAVRGQRDQVLVVDLGMDRVYRYQLMPGTGRLRSVGEVALPAGSGPRHLVTAGSYAYVAGELDSTVSVVDLEAERGAGAFISNVATRPWGSNGVSYPSAIRLSPDGRFCYVANRGPETVSVFQVEGRSLRLIGEFPCGGRHPRDLVLDPDGRGLFVANVDSGDVASFDLANGGRSAVCRQVLAVPGASSILFT
jgi:6-phosphogluconolactonase